MADTLIKGERNLTRGELDMEDFSQNNALLFTLCERRIHRIRKRYLRAVMRQDMAWFDTQEIGALTSRMSSGVEKLKDGIGDKMGLLFSALGSFVSGIGLGFYLSWKMTLVMMFTVPVLLGAMFVSAKPHNKLEYFQMISRASKSETYAYSTAGGLANEVIAGIRTVMAFNAQPAEIHRYEKELNTARKLGIHKGVVLGVFAGLNVFLMFAAMAVYGTTLVVKGEITPGTVFAVFWSVLVGTRRLGDAIPQMGAILGARLAAADIFAVIDRVPDIDSSRMEGFTPEEITGRLSFTNVHFTYPSRPTVKILNDVSYEVRTCRSWIENFCLRDSDFVKFV
ncbi:unnamed protein product [Strongylus vulgaris]|uniref:ABC transmembrane type-1 domain-containing protein n=1 Tax=Strongylus vulgaris TaxID=40348 RepID=A0A3P7KBG8_STRVU|nr:unnamed protein product [Strongylus vulgaris]